MDNWQLPPVERSRNEGNGNLIIIIFNYCPPNCALSQFLWFDKLTNQTKTCASAPKMHLFFYKYETSPRLLSSHGTMLLPFCHPHWHQISKNQSFLCQKSTTKPLVWHEEFRHKKSHILHKTLIFSILQNKNGRFCQHFSFCWHKDCHIEVVNFSKL